MINLPFGLLPPMFLLLGIIVFFAIHFFINDDWEELRIGLKAVTIIATFLSMIFLAGNAIEAKKDHPLGIDRSQILSDKNVLQHEQSYVDLFGMHIFVDTLKAENNVPLKLDNNIDVEFADNLTHKHEVYGYLLTKEFMFFSAKRKRLLISSVPIGSYDKVLLVNNSLLEAERIETTKK